MKVALGCRSRTGKRKYLRGSDRPSLPSRPIDYAAVVESVKKTNRLVIVEEAWPLSSIATEITYHVQSHAFDYLDAPVHRVNSFDVPLALCSYT